MEASGASTAESSPPCDLNEVWGMPQKNYSYFNFVVAERKKYIPGSGPKLQPVTAALKHDKTGYIIDRVFLEEGGLRYLVGFKDHPQLRVSVRPENILNWVSEWAAEDWEHKSYIQGQKEEEERLLPLLLAKKASKQKKMEQESREGVDKSVKADDRKRKRSKSPTSLIPNKKFGIGHGPGRPSLVDRLSKFISFPGPGRRNQPADEPVTRPFTSPTSQRRMGTGLAHPIKPLSDSEDSDSDSNSESDSSEDSEDTGDAIDAQLRNENPTDLDSDSPDSLVNGTTEDLNTRGKDTFKQTSALGRTGSTPSVASSGIRTSTSFVDRSAVATTSSCEAGLIWDTLMQQAEQNSSTKNTLPFMKNDATEPEPSKKLNTARAHPSSLTNQPSAPSASDDEAAMMARFERENYLRANRSTKHPAPQTLNEDATERQEREDIANAIRLSMIKQKSVSSAGNASLLQRSNLQYYKSQFDEPTVASSGTYTFPYGNHPIQPDTMTAYGSSSRFPLSLSSSQPRTHHPVPEPTSEDQEMVEVDLGDNGDEAEYNVDRILDVETRVVKGESVRYYLIQWEGDWDNTWEPQQNVGDEAIREFKAMKRILAKQASTARSTPKSDKHGAASLTPNHDKQKRSASRQVSVAARQTRIPVGLGNIFKQSRNATPKLYKQKNAQVWRPFSGGDKGIPNNPKCPPCIVARKGHCYGGVPCKRCAKLGLSAKMCTANVSNKLPSIQSRPHGPEAQDKERLGNKRATLSVNGTGNRKQDAKPAPVVMVISSDEEE